MYRTLLVISKGRVPYDEKHYGSASKSGHEVVVTKETNFNSYKGQEFDLVLFIGAVCSLNRHKFTTLLKGK